jgi:hypothetical protein
MKAATIKPMPRRFANVAMVDNVPTDLDQNCAAISESYPPRLWDISTPTRIPAANSPAPHKSRLVALNFGGRLRISDSLLI